MERLGITDKTHLALKLRKFRIVRNNLSIKRRKLFDADIEALLDRFIKEKDITDLFTHA